MPVRILPINPRPPQSSSDQTACGRLTSQISQTAFRRRCAAGEIALAVALRGHAEGRRGSQCNAAVRRGDGGSRQVNMSAWLGDGAERCVCIGCEESKMTEQYFVLVLYMGDGG